MGSQGRVTRILFQKENLFLKLMVHVVRQAFSLRQKVGGGSQRKWHLLFLLTPFGQFAQHSLAAGEACDSSLLDIS